MNAEDPRGPRPNGEPTIPGPDLTEVAASLRAALDAEARTIEPDERLDAILAEATGASFVDGSEPARHRWLVPAAAAAAALVVAGALWVASRPPESFPVTAGTATSAARPSPDPSPAASSIPTVTPTGPSTDTATIPVLPVPTATGSTPGGSQTSGVVSVSLPVYYLGPRYEGSTSWALFREFVPRGVTSPATADLKATESLRLAMGTPPPGSTYVAPWRGVDPLAVTVSPSSLTVRLSSGLTDVSGEQARLAVQQLVWTAQAAAGQSTPVSFVLDDGGTEVAPGYPVGRSYTRPTDPAKVLSEVSAVWIDEPYRGAVLPARRSVEVSGIASTFEANVEWQVLRLDGDVEVVVESGFTTASIAAPGRGTFAFTAKALPAGAYAVRVFESSAKDGSVAAEQQIPFTVR